MAESVTLVETPRDAFQGLTRFIPTAEKIRYVDALLDAGFKHIDLGSFVAPKAVPQMADSAALFNAFANHSAVERIAIVVNETGAQRAFATKGVDTLGFPFSISDRFQKANSGKLQFQTWPILTSIRQQAALHKKRFILYLSMAFGTRYSPSEELPWVEENLLAFIEMLVTLGGIQHISLADTVGVATSEQVSRLFRLVRKLYPSVLFSAHFHGTSKNWMRCIDAALESGCRRFDCAAGGLGGCPFACDTLIANTPSEKLVKRLEQQGFRTGIDFDKVAACAKTARQLQKLYA